MTTIDEYKSKIKAAKAELLSAGPIHARDLKKYIHRLEKELKIMQHKGMEGDTHCR